MALRLLGNLPVTGESVYKYECNMFVKDTIIMHLLYFVPVKNAVPEISLHFSTSSGFGPSAVYFFVLQVLIAASKCRAGLLR